MNQTGPAEPAYFFVPHWPLMFEDNHLLCLYKPAGLLVQGDQTGDDSLLDLAKTWLKIRYHKPGRVYLGLLHRLDRPVAGVVLFARTSKAAGRLSGQFRSKQTGKEYLAVVAGQPSKPAGRLIHFLERKNGGSSRISLSPSQGKQESRLTYRLIDSDGSTSLLSIRLETGRKHQIRVQLAGIGCPILGDLRYGAARPLPGRQIALLAWRLRVTHPIGKHTLLLQCPIPNGWPWPGKAPELSSVPWNWAELAKELPAQPLSKRLGGSTTARPR